MKNQSETQQRQLTSNQKEFLLENFFKNEEYAGWRNVATKLLESGRCIVAGKTRMWIGGVGNFIQMEDAHDAIDCTLYKFDLDYFMTSEWYKDIYSQYISILYNEKLSIDTKYKEIADLNS